MNNFKLEKGRAIETFLSVDNKFPFIEILSHMCVMQSWITILFIAYPAICILNKRYDWDYYYLLDFITR